MRATIRRLLTLIATALGLALLHTPAFAQAPSAGAAPEITRVRGDLYRVQSEGRATVFLVTSDGIILADPVSIDTAVWLHKELETRFPDRPVKYVLHTHHHFDRAEGASVFNTTAELVGHRRFNSELSVSRRLVPPHLSVLDRNRSRVFDRDELANDPTAAPIVARDRDGDGRVTLDELYRRVRDVETVYDYRRTIELGGHIVELIHTPSTHAVDMTMLYFPAERLVFAVDHPALGAAPFSFGSLRPKDTIEWVRTVLSLDVDVLVSGDGSTATRTEISALGDYFTDLVASVMAGYELGLRVDELSAVSSLRTKYTGTRYALRDTHVAEVFGRVGTVATEIYGAAFMGYAIRNSEFCSPILDECTPPRSPIPSSALGVRLSGRRIGVAIEMRTEQQSTYFERYQFTETTSAHRETRLSFLARFNLSPRHRSRLALVAGPSVSLGKTKHISFLRQGVVPYAGPTAYEWNEVAAGLTVGAETGVSLGGRASLLIPVRMTMLQRDRDSVLGSVDTYAGVGLTLRLFQSTFLK